MVAAWAVQLSTGRTQQAHFGPLPGPSTRGATVMAPPICRHYYCWLGHRRLFLGTLLQPDLGTAILLLGIAVIVLFIGGVPLRYLDSSLVVALPFLYVALVHVGFRWRRLLAFWDPWSVRLDAGFQIVQSLLAFGNGGLVGVGPGAGNKSCSSYPKPTRISYSRSSVKSLGFLVVSRSSVVRRACSGMAWRWRGVRRTCLHATSPAGITSMVLLQAVMNIAVVVGYLPTKGLPLPFVSHGGSSLMVTHGGGGNFARDFGPAT